MPTSWSRPGPGLTALAPTLSVLRELTRPDALGEAVVREEAPEMHVVENVLFVPDAPEGKWGVFHADGEPVEATLDYSLPWSEPMRPRPTTPVDPASVTEALPEGDYLYLGFMHLHFGHFLIDSLARAWALLDIPAQERPKILFHGWGDPNFWWGELPWLGDIFTGLGLRGEDFLLPPGPVWIKRLMVPSRTWQGQAWANSIHGRVCRRIGAGLLEGAPVQSGGPPAYLSKTRLPSGVRKVVNEQELEDLLRARGVEILYPEAMRMRDQVALFASGRTVCGTTTSAFHVSLFAPPTGRIAALETAGQINSNHLLVDGINNNQATYWHPAGSSRLSGAAEGWMIHEVFDDPTAIAQDLLKLL